MFSLFERGKPVIFLYHQLDFTYANFLCHAYFLLFLTRLHIQFSCCCIFYSLEYLVYLYHYHGIRYDYALRRAKNGQLSRFGFHGHFVQIDLLVQKFCKQLESLVKVSKGLYQFSDQFFLSLLPTLNSSFCTFFFVMAPCFELCCTYGNYATSLGCSSLEVNNVQFMPFTYKLDKYSKKILKLLLLKLWRG